MAEVIIKSLVTFFAIFGFVQLLREFVGYMFSKIDNGDLVVVIKVRNSEETIEATVRMVIWKSLSYSHGGRIPDILIVDMGSDDSTPVIAKKLCDDYSFIHYTTEDLYNKAKE